MTITKTDILEMAKALVHICNYECYDYGERHALDIADGIAAIFKDITGMTVVSCGDYKVEVKESFNRVCMEVN